MSRPRVLILGGTGAMGIYLVPELLGAGLDVVVTSRSLHASDSSRLQYIQGNARDWTFLQSVISRSPPDAVVDFMAYGTDEFAARCTPLLNRTGQYLFLSSYRVFADSSPAPLTERSPRLLDVCPDTAYLATDEYALAKARQEDLLRGSGKSHWTILRPCITYSRNRFQLGTLEANTLCYRAWRGLPVVMAREILAKQTTLTWAGDVAKMVARLVLNRTAWSEDYNVATAEHRLWSEIADYYRQFLDLRLMETDLSTYARVVGRPYQIKYDRMYDRIMDNSKILAATGMAQSELMPLHKGLHVELEHARRNSLSLSPDLLLNARMDQVTKTRMPLAGLSLKRKFRYLIEKHSFSP